jgi:hypothetical protein
LEIEHIAEPAVRRLVTNLRATETQFSWCLFSKSHLLTSLC